MREDKEGGYASRERGRERETVGTEGPHERRIDSVRNTRFQLLGYHFIKPGLELFPVLPAGSTVEATMSPLTNDERRGRDCIPGDFVLLPPPPSQPFFFVGFRDLTENIRGTRELIFSSPSHAQFPQYKTLQAFSKFFSNVNVLKDIYFLGNKERGRKSLNCKCAKSSSVNIL